MEPRKLKITLAISSTEFVIFSLNDTGECAFRFISIMLSSSLFRHRSRNTGDSVRSTINILYLVEPGGWTYLLLNAASQIVLCGESVGVRIPT